MSWFEHGDLVPLLVIVSAAHYVAVLSEVDAWWSAVSIGLLVDIGHYRSVLIATRYNGDKTKEKRLRWAVALAMTVLSFSYHYRFYSQDIALSLPMPLLIASLAYFEQKDGWRKRKKSEPDFVESKANKPESEPEQIESEESEDKHIAFCERCQKTIGEYKTERGVTNALNAHARKCK